MAASVDAKFNGVVTMRYLVEGGARLELLDQSHLPHQTVYITCTKYPEIIDAIFTMKVRGAPAIGTAAAYGMALAARELEAGGAREAAAFRGRMQTIKEELDSARPTAVNLMYATARIMELIDHVIKMRADTPVSVLRECVEGEAARIFSEDVSNNRRLGEHGVSVVREQVLSKKGAAAGPLNIEHHCNTGHLATAGHGTALGVIFSLVEAGHDVHVWVDETRPRLQGAKLTCWELVQQRIPHKLVVDGASGLLMYNGKVDCVVFGADRVAANGDVANKIGTFNLAMAAKAHGVPAYACVPTSTIDVEIASGRQIHIEERSADEVTVPAGKGQQPFAPLESQVFNPAFDVTPADFLSAIITEEGVLFPPFGQNLRDAKARALERERATRQDGLRAIEERIKQL